MKNLKKVACIIIVTMFYLSVLWGQTERHESLKTNALDYLNQKAYQIIGDNTKQIDFSHKRTDIDQLDIGHSRFKVLYKNIPIFANVIIVHFDQSDNAVRNSGGKIPVIDYNFPVEPTLTAETAIEIVRNRMDAGTNTNILDTTLMIWDGLLIDPSFTSVNLIWKVEMKSTSPPGEWVYLIDANSGEVIHFYNNIKFTLNRSQYDLECCANGYSACYPGTFLFGEGGSSNDPDAQGVYDNLYYVWSYYNTNHARDSYDNNGATIISSVHVGNDYGYCGYYNAFWSPDLQQFSYGDGDIFAQALDVVGHEFTHAVNEYTADMVYSCQSGALSESLSDVFASFIDDDEWIMGDVLGIDFRRSLEDPTLYNQPDHMDDYLNTSSDNGGVHTNSGITNKAFHYIANAFIEKYGKNEGIEWIGKIYYRALSYELSENSNFIDLRNSIIDAAEYYFSGDDYILNAIIRSFAAVGIGSSDITLYGSVSQNETWSGFVPLIGDITIPSSKTLTIQEGTKIVFKGKRDYESSGNWSNRTEIIVNGTLNIQGQSANPVELKSSIMNPSSSDWGGIRVISGGSIDIDYAIISDAFNGIYATNANYSYINDSKISNCYGVGIELNTSHASIQNCMVEGNYQGIYLNSGSGGTVKNCVIKNNTNIGIYQSGFNGTFRVEDNILTNNGYGIRSWTANPTLILNNTIDSNYIGIWVYHNGSYSDTRLRNNIVTNSTGEGIFNGGGNNSNYDVRYNDVWNNSGGNYHNIANDAGGFSQNPIFVGGTPFDYHLQNTSPCIDSGDPWEPDDPDGTISDIGAIHYPRPNAPLNLKMRMFTHRHGTNWVRHPKLIWDSNTEADISRYKIYRKIGENGNWSFVTFKNHTNGNQQTWIDEGIIVVPGGNTRVHYKITAWNVNPPNQESNYSNTVNTKTNVEENEKTLVYIPTHFKLHDNYPNPFNPETTIQYELPEQSKVQLIIYDLLGREIKTLKSVIEDAGFYSIKWNGKDENGNPLTSGMYLLNIYVQSIATDKNFSDSNKLILLK